MEKIAKPWDLVMQAYYKQSVRDNKQRREEHEAYEKVFGGKGTKMTCEAILEIFKAGGLIIDVRNPVDYNAGGRIHNSVNIPQREVGRWLEVQENITFNTPILVYSNTGHTANTVLVDLTNVGYKNITNIGTHKWYNLCS
tara:strand:- start:218 stop:637 length:420 start_codon:yes stop_codon:yes gene_type:complete